ncbi:MAG: site-specific integrase [Gammaproteobacteria bacterium]|nr:site-specific integrase [Gammaproteobacteria bacterium]
MNTLRPADIRHYVSLRKQDGVSNATVNRELEVLSAAINHANREWEWMLPNPVPGRYLEESEGRLRWISKAEAVSLLRAAAMEKKAPHLPDFVTLALHTGMRRSEILGLEWRRVDLQTNLIYLEAEHTKSKKRRSVPINRTARASVMNRLRFRAARCPASPWVFCNEQGERIKDVKRSFATACRRAGITNFRVHDLRHTCAAWLVTDGVPLSEVRDLLGHSTVTVTERYAHLAPENVRSAVQRLDRKRSTNHALFI